MNNVQLIGIIKEEKDLVVDDLMYVAHCAYA